jgi:hypothetical protein
MPFSPVQMVCTNQLIFQSCSCGPKCLGSLRDVHQGDLWWAWFAGGVRRVPVTLRQIRGCAWTSPHTLAMTVIEGAHQQPD